MRTYTETDVRRMLGLPAKDPRVDFENDWNGSEFKDAECVVDKCPHVSAAVFLDWTRPGFDPDTDRPNQLNLEQWALCWEHARADIAEALDETEPFAHDDDVYIKVVVNGWYLVYGLGQVAA
ncbi:hypothetical protein [Nocardia xishanensis]|uniref:hypothetical protein n=1 Tax=Nocardia xishanensis TaxID=238964 RepID=UPI0008336175|nr:hypothetical protein [Nocardia xishanensis]